MACKSVLAFGAGCVGRGFLGQLFAESNYAITYVEIDDPLIDALNAKRSYTLRLVDNDWQQALTIPVQQTLHCFRDHDAVVEVMGKTPLVTTAVGTRSLPDVAPLIADGMVHRAQHGVKAPLHVLICENMQDAATTFQAMVQAHVPEAHMPYFEQHAGFVDVVIGRTIPRPVRNNMPSPSFIMAEPYKELPVNRRRFLGPVPDIVGILPVDNFQAYIERKLFIHNCGHAILGYLGYLRGHTSSWDALQDPAIAHVLKRAFAESKAGFHAAYGIPKADLDAHITDLLRRFANRALTDTVHRLARDPLRKLGLKDRLVGPARLAEKAGVFPEALSWGIAAGYAFDYAEDPLAGQLQQRIAVQGLAKVMAAVSAIRPEEPLGRRVLENYRILRETGLPDVRAL